MPATFAPELFDIVTQLREAIDRLQAELRSRPDRRALLALREAEVELSFTIQKELSGDAGVNLYAFKVGLGGKHDSAQTHRLKLVLVPHVGPVPAAKRAPTAPPRVTPSGSLMMAMKKAGRPTKRTPVANLAAAAETKSEIIPEQPDAKPGESKRRRRGGV